MDSFYQPTAGHWDQGSGHDDLSQKLVGHDHSLLAEGSMCQSRSLKALG